MKLPSVIEALGSLWLLLADGLPVAEVDCPEIIGKSEAHIKAYPGELLVLHCDAFTNYEDGLTLIYWLVDGAFPEDLPSSDRIVESEKSTLGEGTILQRSLLLKNVTSQDFKSNFTCVVTSAVGTAQKKIKIVRRKKKSQSVRAVKRTLL